MKNRFLLILLAAATSAASCNDGRAVDGTTDATTIDDVGNDAIGIDVDDDVPDVTIDFGLDPREDVPSTDVVEDVADVAPDEGIDTSPDAEPDIPEGCGDSVINDGEECDDGEDNSNIEIDACRTDCTLAVCGDGVADSGEECDDGEGNSNVEIDACRTDCSEPICGDGVTDSDEDCDGGPDCSDECTNPLASLCSECAFDDECGGDEDFCVDGFCGLGCDDSDCPRGFECADVIGGLQCVPSSGTCEPCFDPDGDGYGIGEECLGLDCEEGNSDVNPGAAEECDGVDNNCNGFVDEAGGGPTWHADNDGDGAGSIEDFIEACEPSDEYPSAEGGDCDDDDSEVFPGAVDLCNGVDNDCDEDTVDGNDEELVGGACDGLDDDRCAGGTTECVEGALICTEGPEGTRELCDGVDNDCDPDTADGSDDPRVGDACDGEDSDLCEEGLSICRGGELLCDDSTDDQIEICDGEDNDCDGTEDEDAGDLWFRDSDGDRFGTEDETTNACIRPPGFSARSGDCNDDESAVNPDEEDICDRLNNDCVGEADDDPAFHETGWPDIDGDGFGDSSADSSGCEIPPDYVDNGEDCNDDSAAAAPGLDEVCDDGLDNDCNDDVDCADGACAEEEECVVDCSDDSIGDTIGLEASTGTTEGAGNELTAGCSGGGGPEVVLEWTAPETGTFIMDTLGSDFDTTLYVLDGCEGEEIACNDDAFDGGERLRSQVTFDAEAGSNLLIVVDGFGGGSAGDYVLNIRLDLDEICDSGEDEDGDGDIDCADTDCVGDDACLEVCDDAEDNDLDGDTDCDDSDCLGDDACVEICDDGADNDGDDEVDCFDIDCAGDDVCRFDGCAAAEITGTGEIATGSTEDFAYSYIAECGSAAGGTPAGGENARDAFYIWTAPASGTFVIDTLGSTFDTLLAVLDGECGGEEIACNDDGFAGEEQTRSSVEIEVSGGDVVTIALGGWGFSSGDYVLNATRIETACGDDIDNDEDGDIDCDDSDCAETDGCFEVCDDRFDNDGDGDIDCADADCDAVCIEICDDAVDNDRDGLTDCADADCEFDEACCPDDVFENNQGVAGAPSTLWDAYNADSTATLTIRPGDVDSFRIPMCTGGTLRATAEFSHDDGDLSMVLRNSTGFTIVGANSDDDNESLAFTSPFTTDLFLQVNIEDDLCQSYTLTMELVCP
ncbi:MAG: hypothetical protein ACJAYU_000082 [Bradymonadia bacterium]|jgi:hypothetical protein